MIEIKSYIPDKYLEVRQILQDANHFDENWDSEENLLEMVKKDKDSILIAVDGNKVVGVVYIILMGGKVGVIYRLVVKKDYQKQGIATSLINKVEEILKQKNVSEVGMYVNASNPNIQEFYKKRKYKTSSDTAYIYMWQQLI